MPPVGIRNRLLVTLSQAEGGGGHVSLVIWDDKGHPVRSFDAWAVEISAIEAGAIVPILRVDLSENKPGATPPGPLLEVVKHG